MSIFIKGPDLGDSFRKRSTDALTGGNPELAEDLFGYSVKEDVNSLLSFFSDELFNEMIHEFDVNGESKDSEDNENLDTEGEEEGEAENPTEEEEQQTKEEPANDNNIQEDEEDNDENFELPEDEEDNASDTEQNDENSTDGEEPPPEDNDEDFSIDGEDNEEETGENSEPPEDDVDNDSETETTDHLSKLKELETVAFADLTDTEKEAKTKELKKIYINIYDKCKVLANKTNDIKKDDSTIQIVEYINNSLTDLRQYILDYTETIFDSKSYMENIAQVQKYIAVLSSINTIFDELKNDFIE